MRWFGSTHSQQKEFWRALEACDSRAVEALLEKGASPHWKRKDGLTPLRHALREENLALLGVLLQHGVALDAEAVGAMALWAERAERAQRHGKPDAAMRVGKAKLAIGLMDKHQAPWDLGIPSLGSGDSARVAINHVFPGCLASTSG